MLKRSVQAAHDEAREHAENTVIRHADLPLAQLAESALQELDNALWADLSEVLLLEHFARLIRILRRKQARPKQMVFAGFEHLPRRIPIGDGKTKLLADATFKNLERYVKHLGRQYQNRRQQDPKLKEAIRLQDPKLKEAIRLRDRLKKRNDWGATVKEVLQVL